MDPRKRRADLAWLAAAAAAAALALIWPALSRGEGLLPVGMLWRVPPWNAVLPAMRGNGLLSDQLLYFWPWRLFERSSLLGGTFPFWNPLIDAGVPFAACVQAAPFYPTNLFLTVMSPAAWSLFAAFAKLFAGGLFAGLHARRLGADRAGAALSAVVFALSGFMVAWLGHPQTNVACLLPALFWALGRAFDRDTPRAWVPLALVTGVLLLGGHPPTQIHVLLAGAAYALFLSRRAPESRRRARLTSAALAVAAGVLLAAPALLPYLEYLAWSSTFASAASLSRWGTRLSPWALLHLLMPLASGSPARGFEILGAAFWGGPSNFLERAGWVGLPALALAALALARRRRDPEVLFHAGLAAFGLAAALGVPPLPWLWRVLPGVSAANPTRLLLMFCFGAATLAGLGASDDAPASRRLLAVLAGTAAFALVLDLTMVLRIWGGLHAGERGFALGQAAAFLAEAAAALWLAARPSSRRWAAPVAGVFLLRAGLGLNPAAPESLLYPETPAIAALKDAQGEGRVYGLGPALAPDLGMPFGLRDARGRDFVTLRRYEELLTGKAGSFDFFERADAVPYLSRLLGLSALAATPAGESAVPESWAKIHDGDLAVYRSPDPAHRALFVPEAVAATPAKALAAVHAPGFDPAKTAWLDDWFEVPEVKTPRPASGAATVSFDDANEVVVDVRADGPGWLVLLDSWYPGWRVYVNGKLAALRRADYAFRAVAVPGGESTVRFVFVPFSFWIGAALAALAALGLAVAWRKG
jgi:hypothetical protein